MCGVEGGGACVRVCVCVGACVRVCFIIYVLLFNERLDIFKTYDLFQQLRNAARRVTVRTVEPATRTFVTAQITT